MVDAERLRLLGLVDGADPRQHRLNVVELAGYLLLMLHWQRGIIDMLVQEHHVKLTEAQQENWNRVIHNLESYEAFAWELAPARALLPLMRHYRLTGELPPNFELLASKDELGRVPYNESNLDYIEDILRRIKDCRIYKTSHEDNA